MTAGGGAVGGWSGTRFVGTGEGRGGVSGTKNGLRLGGGVDFRPKRGLRVLVEVATGLGGGVGGGTD